MTRKYSTISSPLVCVFLTVNPQILQIANSKIPPPHHFLVFLSKRENISRTVKYSGAVSLEALTKFSKFFWDFSL